MVPGTTSFDEALEIVSSEYSRSDTAEEFYKTIEYDNEALGIKI